MFVSLNRTLFVDRITCHVQDTAKRGCPNRNHDRVTRICHGCATYQTFGGVHRDGANRVFAQVLRYFQNKGLTIVVSRQRVQDLRQVIVELHVDNGANDLCHPTNCVCHLSSPSS